MVYTTLKDVVRTSKGKKKTNHKSLSLKTNLNVGTSIHINIKFSKEKKQLKTSTYIS